MVRTTNCTSTSSHNFKSLKITRVFVNSIPYVNSNPSVTYRFELLYREYKRLDQIVIKANNFSYYNSLIRFNPFSKQSYRSFILLLIILNFISVLTWRKKITSI